MAICERCSRSLDRVQRDRSFKSATDEALFVHSQVRRIDHEIHRLAAQRVLLQRRLNAIAPSTVLLPYEIIARIFRLLCPPLDLAHAPDAPDTPPNNDGGLTYPTIPFTLAAVSSHWRDIALSTPQLWTSVALTLYQTRSTSNAHALDALFTRSAPCPVSLSLVFASVDEPRETLPSDVPPSSDVLRVFLAHSHRWQSLKIDGLPPEWIPDLTQATNATPNLHHLWLCPYDNSREQQMLDMFSNAPQLRRVTLDNTFLSAIALPWSALTHLKVSWVSIDECAEILRRCPSLVDCDFSRILSNAEFHPLPPPAHSPIVLPSLRTLAWSYAGDAWEFHLFERILFPNLTAFKLKLRYDLMQFSIIVSVLRVMLGETSRDVDRLELDLGCPWLDLYEVLKQVKRVTVLRLVDEQDEQMVRKLMEALVVVATTTPRQDSFLPRLRVLEWRGHCWVDFVMVKWVVEKLKMRWEMDNKCSSESRLEKVTLDLTCGGHLLGLMDGERLVSDELRELERMGIDVVIVHRRCHRRRQDQEGEAEEEGEGWLDVV